MANIKCIDVSTWQGSIDWKKVKKSGCGYAIIRAGFGRETSQIDNQFERNYKNAKAAGVKLGVYWYSYAVNRDDAVKEAKACLSVLKGKSLEMPVFFDMEENFMTKYSRATLTDMAKAFCDTVIKGGFESGVYSNLNWFTNYLNYSELKALYPIWLAQWSSSPQLECDIWQYSSEGTVAGIDGYVDMNIIYSDDVVKSASKTEKETKVNYEIAAVQSLLVIAEKLNLISNKIPIIDNISGDSTKTAILQMKKHLGQKEDDSITLQFIKGMNSAIIGALPKAGDVNRDGVVDIKDATAIQKLIAKKEG